MKIYVFKEFVGIDLLKSIKEIYNNVFIDICDRNIAGINIDLLETNIKIFYDNSEEYEQIIELIDKFKDYFEEIDLNPTYTISREIIEREIVENKNVTCDKCGNLYNEPIYKEVKTKKDITKPSNDRVILKYKKS